MKDKEWEREEKCIEEGEYDEGETESKRKVEWKCIEKTRGLWG